MKSPLVFKHKIHELKIMPIKQNNLFESTLQQLVEKTTRDDDWVNATKWCEHFGKQWKNIVKQPSFKRYLKALQNKLLGGTGDKKSLVKSINKGRAGSETWIHPLVAIKLAEWLSPDFDIFVKETFKRYLDGDITLADNIVQRSQSPQDLEWLQKRLDGKIARRAFTDELKKHGVTGVGYAMNTNAIYKPLLGKTAQELREERKITSSQLTRDNLSALELSAIGLAELAALTRMQKSEASGNTQTCQISQDTANKVKQAIADIL